MATVDPLFRLSPHFLLADFLGNHSCYTRGYRNSLEGPRGEVDKKLENATALCTEILEPLLSKFGPLSISYGYISPELSRHIVTYQDPNKPSHHRWDLGAAADVCSHNWVAGQYPVVDDPSKNLDGSPVALAFDIDNDGARYSRIITYSESPFLCLAVSAAELAQDKPRFVMYENRYEGKAKAKPDWRTYSSRAVRRREWGQLLQLGLPCPWEGKGHPTYHGGGLNQYQHRRVSKYTMMSDWLLDLQSIANGWKNMPAVTLDSVQDALGAAGLVYDLLIEEVDEPRFSIVAGYVSHLSPAFNPENDWRSDRIAFTLVPADESALEPMAQAVHRVGGAAEIDGKGLWISVNVEEVYAFANSSPET
jgi:hypothetical protein